MLFVIVLSFLVMGSMAQTPGTDRCKKMKGIKNFDEKKILRKWHVYAHYPLMLEQTGRCHTNEFSENPDGSFRGFLKQLVDKSNTIEVLTHTVELISKDGKVTCIGPKNSPWYGLNFTIPSTDYASYIVKALCQNIGSSSLEVAWILTKSPHPSQKVLAKIDKGLKNEGISTKDFKLLNKTNCPSNF